MAKKKATKLFISEIETTAYAAIQGRIAFQAMPEDSTIVQYCDTKLDMLYYLFHFNLGHWIDWETGKVSFDDEEFRSYLEFVNEFPLEFDWSDPETVNEEIGSRMLSGRQMLTRIDPWRYEKPYY